jgi:peptidyl-Asp metalloendopeptidase
MSRSIRVVLAAALLVAGFSAGDAVAQGLFAPSAAKSGPAFGDGSPGVVRWRPTDIDVGYLMGQISSGAKAAGQSSTISLNLFDDVTASIEVWDTGVAGVQADRVLSGWVPRSENSLATIVVNQGQVTGKIWMDGALYRFRPGAGGGYTIAEVDPSRFPEAADSPPPGQRSSGKALSSARAEGEPIDVLLLFTKGAAKLSHKLEDEVAVWMAEMNEIHRRSGAATSKVSMFRLVGFKTIGYVATKKTATDVNRLAGRGDGYMDHVHELRDQLGADLVSLIYVGDNSGCGRVNNIGPMPGKTQADPDAAFSVVAFGCASDNLSFAHELGHNIGARHDYLADNTPGYNHGYVNLPAKWRSVMAYNTKCKKAGKYCARLPFFSNPYKVHKGDPTGIHKNKRDPAYNVELIRKNRSLIAAYRKAKPAGQTTQPTQTTQGPTMKCKPPPGAGTPRGVIGGLPYWVGHLFVGLHYRGAYAKGWNLCHEQCVADKNCVSWTYIGADKKCLFKHYCPTKRTFTQMPAAISGYSGRPSVCGAMRPGCGEQGQATTRTVQPPAPTVQPPAPTVQPPAPAVQQPTQPSSGGWQAIN